jgi:hypothetical protein
MSSWNPLLNDDEDIDWNVEFLRSKQQKIDGELVTDVLRERNRRILLLAIVTAVAACTAAQSIGSKEGSSQETAQRTYPVPTNLKVLSKTMTGQQVHDMMLRWSGELGAWCNACHDEEQDNVVSGGPARSRFANDSKPMKEIARRMYTMTEEINRAFITKVDNSGMLVTCGTCHQGRISPELQPLLSVEERAAKSAPLP